MGRCEQLEPNSEKQVCVVLIRTAGILRTSKAYDREKEVDFPAKSHGYKSHYSFKCRHVDVL